MGPGVPAPGPLLGTGSGYSQAFCGPSNPASSETGGPSLGRPARSPETSLCTLRLLVCRRDASLIDDDASRASPSLNVIAHREQLGPVHRVLEEAQAGGFAHPSDSPSEERSRAGDGFRDCDKSS